MEREKGFEPSTLTLARLHSTAELFPQGKPPYAMICLGRQVDLREQSL